MVTIITENDTDKDGVEGHSVYLLSNNNKSWIGFIYSNYAAAYINHTNDYIKNLIEANENL